MNRRARTRRAFCRIGLATGLMLGAPVSMAATPAASRGRIRFDGLRIGIVEQVWYLYGRAEVHLSPAMRTGLDNGVPLNFVLDVALHERRPLWFDRTVLTLERRSALVYYDLTGHYRLQVDPVSRRFNNGWAVEPQPGRMPAVREDSRSRSRNFRSLKQALDSLGDVRGLALAVVERAHPAPERLYGTIRLRLDDRALPLPLQPIFDSTWRLSSGEQRWHPWRSASG